MRRLGGLGAFLLLTVGAWGLVGCGQSTPQGSEKEPGTQMQGREAAKAMQTSWNEIRRKIIAVAEDMPEEKYDIRPVDTIRPFSAQLLHVAGSNYWYLNTATGEKRGDGSNDPSRETYQTKQQVVEFLRKSFDDVAAYLGQPDNAALARPVNVNNEQTNPYRFWSEAIEHCGEHYGQIVVYYRTAKMVPPESRPKN